MVKDLDYIESLRKALGDKVKALDFERFVYGADWSPRTQEEVYPPDVVVVPENTEDVVKLVRIAYEHGIPVTAGGGLTGMLGSAVPIYGGIYIDTMSMNKILEIDEKNQTITVQAGVTLQAVNDAVEPLGLWLPHQPESKWSCTVGASIACDNDSTFGMRFGKILNCLLSATVVTGRGDAVAFGHRKCHFTSSGYKIKDLFAGSEGTLGVVTEATLKLEPKPEHRRVEMVIFPSLTKAVDFLNELLKAGICPEAAHINCKRRLKFYTHAYKKKHGKEPDIPEWAGAVMGLTFGGNTDVVEWNWDYALKIAKKYGGELIKEKDIAESWWISKNTLQFDPFKQKWPDSQRLKKFGAADPGIPMGRLEEFYQKFVETAEKYNLEILGMNAYLEHPYSIGFSLSCALFVDYRSRDEIERFRAYHRELTKLAVDFGGTMSTYMGDSDIKVGQFEYEHGAGTKYMLELKKLFDPKGIMNPGKKFAYRKQ